VVSTAGTLLGGPFADRVGARSAMMATYILAALGTVGTLMASHPLGLATTIIARFCRRRSWRSDAIGDD
jgi:MFS family permease